MTAESMSQVILRTSALDMQSSIALAKELEAAGYGLVADDKRRMELAALLAYEAVEEGALREAGANALEELVANSPRLPSDVRNVVFEAVFDVVDKFNFPAQNCGTLKDVVEIGDVCGDVEKRIVAIIRARAAEMRQG